MSSEVEIKTPHNPSTMPELIQHDWAMPSPSDRYFQLRISRNISIAIIASLLIHALLLLALAPKLLPVKNPLPEQQQSMVVELGPQTPQKSIKPEPGPQPIPQAQPIPKPKIKTPPSPRKVAEPKKIEESPTVIAVEKPAPNNYTVPTTPPTPAPAPAAPTDMMAYVNAQRDRRRAADGYTAKDIAEVNARDHPQSEDDIRNANIKRNLQQQGTNGIFQIREKRSHTAQFSFRGWKSDYNNAKLELIDVEVKVDGDINRAIVKKMIAIIRKDYSGDFNWESQRLGRTVILSARIEDNAGLEDFLMREFF